MPADASLPNSKQQSVGTWQAWIEIALIFAVFFLHGGWAAPDVNEAHYLAKAKHYWDPSWCANDFFLQSRDAHHVFYWTLGWLTKLIPLAAVAWAGRILTWSLMAWAFRRLNWALAPRKWFGPLTAVLFVYLNESNHMAGEWFDGGLEAKGISYALVFLGLEAMILDRWNRTWILLGAASAFHVLVGGWAVVAAGVVWLFSPRATRATLTSMLPALAVGAALSLPAIIPSITLNAGVSPETATEANRIYVYERLYHHLDLDKFERGFVGRHVTLCLVWLLLITVTPATAVEKRARLFVAGCMGFAVVGYGMMVLARYNQPLGFSLLRFYWYRMSDVFVPWGVATTGMSFIAWQFQTRPIVARRWLTVLVLLAAYDLSTQAWAILVTKPRADKNVQFDDWLEVCRWAKENTPADAVFLTPRYSNTFKWRADRAEVVTWKDVPQDAEHLEQWWKRNRDIHERDNWTETYRWLDTPADKGFDRLAELAQKYHFQYVILEGLPYTPLPDAPALFISTKAAKVNATSGYRVYKMPEHVAE